jgi:hypothetical protein
VRPKVERRSWSHPQAPTSEAWWADVLADPRARKRKQRTDLAVKQAYYRLADEKREIILVACSKCNWRAAFSRDDLIASHGADHPMPNLLDHLAAPNCPRLGSTWDRCGVHYVEPIESGLAPILTSKLRHMELHYQDAIAKARRFGSNEQMFGAK